MPPITAGVRWPSEGRERITACHDCDALLSLPRRISATLLCPRCHCVVLRRVAGGLDGALAFYLAASISFIVGNCLPIVRITAGGNAAQTTMVGAVWALHSEGMNLIAILVLLTTVLIPAAELLCTTTVLLLAETRHPFNRLAFFFRIRQALKPWNMVEILMLGAIVAIVKLSSLASVIIGTGLWALATFMITHAAATHMFDPKDFWSEIKRPP